MKPGPIAAALLCAACAALPAHAQEDPLAAAWEAARPGPDRRPSDSRTPQPAPAREVPACAPAPPEAANPDAFDGNDEFRRNLLDGKTSDLYRVEALGGILLVVQKGYLDAGELARLCSDLSEATREVPRVTRRSPLARTRFTVYVYPGGPVSEAHVPGAQPGETGVMLKFVKEDRAPLFHELTHLLAGYSNSQSLAEGVADYVQRELRPGKANGFMPADADADSRSRAALASYPHAFAEAVGAPGHQSWTDPQVRFDFYYASLSFVDFLLRQGDMKRLWSVIDAGGAPAAYEQSYRRSRAALVAEWKAALLRP